MEPGAALALFRDGNISLGRAAALCGMPLAAFMEFAVARGVAPIQYGDAEYEADQRAMAALGL